MHKCCPLSTGPTQTCFIYSKYSVCERYKTVTEESIIDNRRIEKTVHSPPFLSRMILYFLNGALNCSPPSSHSTRLMRAPARDKRVQQVVYNRSSVKQGAQPHRIIDTRLQLQSSQCKTRSLTNGFSSRKKGGRNRMGTAPPYYAAVTRKPITQKENAAVETPPTIVCVMHDCVVLKMQCPTYDYEYGNGPL